ncbi:MFS transporter [Corynebacterium mendelii]|uniref:MFS transporter n=1 Tax=Corynebacterium mendelii TaxID=2765362 RepID=A0A939IY47_9CORY|nr:MFS transporter [Corynebacterium mendelii]MBN9645155.1 MFS transporter [Corynebacterium mendelii]
MTTTRTPARLTRSARLAELDFTRKHGKLLGASGIGWALDAMDVGLIAFVIAALGTHWGISAEQKSWIVSIGFVGMAIGATAGGLLADRIGRRTVFALTLVIYGAATGATALVGGIGMLLVLRFLVGLGLGAELPVASTLVSEFAPTKIRGRLVVILEAFWAVGWLAAALIGYFVVAGSDNGWRWALALGAVPAVWAIVVRLHAPESVRFLESKGKTRQADAVVAEFEASPKVTVLPRVFHPSGYTESAVTKQAAPARGGLFGADLRRRTIGLWVVWFCINFAYYGAFIWIPSILTSQGFTLFKSFEFTLIMTLAQLPGYFCAAWLIEVWGRRTTLAVFLVGSAAAAGFYGLAGSVSTIIIAGCALSFFNLGAWGALYAISPELFPTRVRGTGTGSAAGVGRIASIITPLLVPVFMAAGGAGLTFGVFAAAFFLAAGATFLLPEQKGQLIG